MDFGCGAVQQLGHQNRPGGFLPRPLYAFLLPPQSWSGFNGVDLERTDCEEDVGWKVRNPCRRIVLCILSSRYGLYLTYIGSDRGGIRDNFKCFLIQNGGIHCDKNVLNIEVQRKQSPTGI